MFYKLAGITEINLSFLNIFQVINMQTIFSRCSSLTSLNLSIFIFFNILSINNMLNSYYYLEYINLYNFDDEGGLKSYDLIFTVIPLNIVIFLN